MKVRINRSTIVLGDEQEAKEMAAAEGSWIDLDVIKYCVARILTKHYGTDIYVESIIKAPELTVTMNHYRMTIWAEETYVKYWHDGMKLATVSFDVLYNYNGNEPEAYLETYGGTFYGCI